jgi:hypothetical protein
MSKLYSLSRVRIEAAAEDGLGLTITVSEGLPLMNQEFRHYNKPVPILIKS